MKVLDAHYYKGVIDIAGREKDDLPEVCFVGRSNVGKSSMINKLVMRQVARTSSTPGATRMINLYKVQYEFQNARREVIFSDFPGFGYARVSKATYGQWEHMIDRYVTVNRFIRLLIWVFDVRRDFDKLDETLLEWTKDCSLDISLVLTKMDKESRSLALQKKMQFRRFFRDDRMFLFSAKEGYGRKELLSHIFETLEGVNADR